MACAIRSSQAVAWYLLRYHELLAICNPLEKTEYLREEIDGIVINAGALSHYGLSLRDALIDAQAPLVTVHLSNIYRRAERFRHRDILAEIAVGGVYGFKSKSYILGLQALVTYIKSTD